MSKGETYDKLQRAGDNWDYCSTRYGNFADRFMQDMRFRHGDSENGYQWNETIRKSRMRRGKPCLTLNMVQVHNQLITNASRQDKMGLLVVPLGNGASLEAAKMYQQLLQRIEAQSSAQAVYAKARAFQVDGGVGYFRITTRWAKGDAFEQELYLETCEDPLAVWLDPDAKLPHGGDSEFGFEWDLVAEARLKKRYPKLETKLLGGGSAFGGYSASYGKPDHVRVCEYIERRVKEVELLSFISPEGERKIIRGNLLPPEVRRDIKEAKTTRSRQVEDYVVESTIYVGDEEAEKTIWPGSYVPIIRVEGVKSILDGQLDYKGHTRSMMDAQRMYNYNASGQVEFGALQGKTPWVGAAEAFEGHEQVWKTANTEDPAFLPFKTTSENGDPISPPQRTEPPQVAPAFQMGMQNALQQMQLVSGQGQNELGQLGNERTGEAIHARQGQSDLATSHFDSNFEDAQVWAAQQLVELIPIIYDTKRLVMIQADSGEDVELEIDPAAQDAYTERLNKNQSVARRIMNPQVGRYEVRAKAGPDAGTRRDQTVKALTLILTQNPQLTTIVGDLLLKNMQFADADEAAKRLHRMIPPQALGKGPDPQMAGLQQQLQKLQALNTKLLQSHAQLQIKAGGKEQKRDIDAYKAVTDRIGVLASAAGISPEAVQALLQGLQDDIQETDVLGRIVDANADELAADTQEVPGGDGSALPHPDARQAPDGHFYIPDPENQGGFMRLEPRQ